MYPRPAPLPAPPFQKHANQNILYQSDLVRSCLPHHHAAGSASPFSTRLLGSCADSQNLLSRDKDSAIYEAKREPLECVPRPWRSIRRTGGLCVCHPRTDNLGCAHTWPAAQLRSGMFLSTQWFLLIKSNTFFLVLFQELF